MKLRAAKRLIATSPTEEFTRALQAFSFLHQDKYKTHSSGQVQSADWVGVNSARMELSLINAQLTFTYSDDSGAEFEATGTSLSELKQRVRPMAMRCTRQLRAEEQTPEIKKSLELLTRISMKFE